MDLRQLGRVAPAPEISRKGEGVIVAPFVDDPELLRAAEELRAAGKVVVNELPGHSNDAKHERRLEKKDGKWRVT